MSARIPVNVLTGFLGSGKTSLLNRLLRDPLFHNCAVLINEFGDIGIDHHLVDRIDGDMVLLLIDEDVRMMREEVGWLSSSIGLSLEVKVS